MGCAVLSVLSRNVISNILGKGLSAVLSLIFVPYYIRLLGPEAYGLIGVFALLQSVFMVADLGLSGAFIRETARLSALEKGARMICDLGRTFEGVFLLLGIIVSLSISISSDLLAEHWVNPETLSLSTVSSSIVLIGIVVGLQFPLFVYQGGLQGLQRQTIMNFLLVSTGLLKGLGSVLVLIYVDQSIQAFFVWNLVVCVIQVVAARFLMWRIFPNIDVHPKFDLRLIQPLWRFAIGMAGISLSGIFLTQIDKIILAKMLSLETFGYYTLAWVVASVPGMIAIPIYNAIYPRFVQLVAVNNFSGLSDLYHRSCQMLSVVLLPIGLIFVFFSREIMFAWTGSIITAHNTYLFVSILVSGSILMGLMILPFALQLAFAWTKLNFILNCISSIILIPALIVLVKNYGALGACFVWVTLYLVQFTVLIHFMHRRILVGEKWEWYSKDIVIPIIPPLVIMSLCRIIITDTMSKTNIILIIVIITIISLIASAMSAFHVRNYLLNKINKL